MQITGQDDQLVGRERERIELERLLDEAQAGRGGLVLLAGEGGVGKTRLAHTVLAGRGLLVLTGAASQAVAVPFGPIVGILRAYLRVVPEGLDASGPLAGYLALLLPELGPAPAEGDLATLFEAIRSAIVAIARRQPTAIILDDLHWADATTLDLLPALANALAQEPVLIVGAYRSDEIPRGHPLRRLRSELRRAGRLRELTLEPLDRAATAALAARLLGGIPSRNLADVLFDRTQGLPFFVEELTASLVAGGRLQRIPSGFDLLDDADVAIPDTVRDAVLLRIDMLSGQGRRALEVAAIAGLYFDLDLVAELAETEAGVAEALEGAIIREIGPGQGAFRHALAREAIYSDVSWMRKRDLHRRIAAHLEARGVPPGVVAEHWLAGRELERARAALLAAAAAAAAVHAAREAAQAARRALDLWPDGEDEAGRLAALDLLGRSAQLTGALPEAAWAWREAADGRRRCRDTQGYAEAERQLALVCDLQGASERAIIARQAAAEAFTELGQIAEAAVERLAMAAQLQRTGNSAAALRMIGIATEQAQQAGRVDLQVRALGLEAAALADQQQIADGIERLRAGLARALEANLVGPAADTYLQLGFMLQRTADYSGARDTFLTGFSFCQARDAPEMATTCLACFAGILQRTGEWDRALELCRELLASSATPIGMRAIAGWVSGSIVAWRGAAQRSRALVAEATVQARQVGDTLTVLYGAWIRAYLDELGGAHDSAVERYQFVLEQWAEVGVRHLVVRPLCWAATCFAGQGRADLAHRCASALAEIAASVGNAESLAGLAYGIGELALLQGDAARAAHQFEQALGLLRELAVPFECAQAQLRTGVAHAAAGQREAAVAHLTSAYHTARNLQARPLIEAIGRELTTLGEPLDQRLGRRAARQLTHSGLSRREREVLRCLAVGRTNREIGQELFLSPRTVEMHVANILAKLDSRSRAEAAQKARELGLLSADAE
ncbi:MAG TPA: AAA family ATPase [Roseiflexaceae bacterium]|nr:AAA family ATPase [Roseiflexaceae bacterium]